MASPPVAGLLLRADPADRWQAGGLDGVGRSGRGRACHGVLVPPEQGRFFRGGVCVRHLPAHIQPALPDRHDHGGAIPLSARHRLRDMFDPCALFSLLQDSGGGAGAHPCCSYDHRRAWRAHRARNADWRDNEALWSAAVRTSPLSFKTHTGLGQALLLSGHSPLDAVLLENERSVAIVDHLPDWQNNSAVYLRTGAQYIEWGSGLLPGEANGNTLYAVRKRFEIQASEGPAAPRGVYSQSTA